MKRTVNPQKAAAGSLGGKQTVKKYGKRYMRRLAKWGAHRMHSIYQLTPAGTSDFALVHRETGEVKGFLSGKHKRKEPS